MSKKKRAERRRFKRFAAQEGAFAALRPHFTKLGQIIDTGEGGLAFRYVAIDKWSEEGSELDIVFAGSAVYLEKLPVRIVSDVPMPKESPFGTFVTRRLSVEFGKLTPRQRSQLDQFLTEHTLNEA